MVGCLFGRCPAALRTALFGPLDAEGICAKDNLMYHIIINYTELHQVMLMTNIYVALTIEWHGGFFCDVSHARSCGCE